MTKTYEQGIVDPTVIFRNGNATLRTYDRADIATVLALLNAEPAPDLSAVKAKHSELIGALVATLDDTTTVDPVRQAAWSLLSSLNQVYDRQPGPNTARNASPSVEIDGAPKWQDHVSVELPGMMSEHVARKLAQGHEPRMAFETQGEAVADLNWTPIDTSISSGERIKGVRSFYVEKGLLERIEAFLAELTQNNPQSPHTALLRDIRAAMGKLKPYTVVSKSEGEHPAIDHVQAVDADDAWMKVQKVGGFTIRRVAVFPGHLKEE